MTAEQLEAKKKKLDECIKEIRRTAMHNGANISIGSDIREVAERCAEADIDRATLVMQDIATIDYVRNVLLEFPPGNVVLDSGVRTPPHRMPIFATRPDKTTAEISALEVNDPTVAVSEYTVGHKGSENLTSGNRRDWAVVKLTPAGAQLVSYGGGFWQGYIAEWVWSDVEEEVTTTDPDTGAETTETATVNRVVATKYTQKGETGLLNKVLGAADAAWMPEVWRADLTGELESYTEGGIEFAVLPCTLPGDLGQLISVVLKRVDVDGKMLPDVSYSLTDVSCDDSNEGMLALPLGCWLIYDNSALASAPQALLVPKALTGENEKHVTGIEIVYSELTSGMDRLRLVSGAFGSEYILSTQELTTGGAWYE